MPRYSALFALLGAASTCRQAPVTARPDHAPAIRTPAVRTLATEYPAQVTSNTVMLRIIAVVTNPTSDTLYLHPCLQQPPYRPLVILDRWDGEAWHPAWGPFCTSALMHNPPRLLPGAMRTDTIHVEASRRPDWSPGWRGPIAGTYRLVYGGVFSTSPLEGAEAGPGTPAAPGLLTSNAFKVVE